MCMNTQSKYRVTDKCVKNVLRMIRMYNVIRKYGEKRKWLFVFSIYSKMEKEGGVAYETDFDNKYFVCNAICCLWM